MSWVSCCKPPKTVPDGVEDSQIWQCPICGQWWEIHERLPYTTLPPKRISRLAVVLYHFSQWRHWHKAHNIDPRDLLDIP